MAEHYLGGTRSEQPHTVGCPRCGQEITVSVTVVDEPRTHGYPGHYSREISAGGTCACGYTLLEEEVPDDTA